MPLAVDTARNAIITQMFLEESVSQSPLPEVTVQEIPNGLFAAIKYTETDSQQPVSLQFSVNA